MRQPTSSRAWPAIQWLMVVVAIAHAYQPLLLDWRPKFLVTISGAILYSVCAYGLFRRDRWALWIAIAGPLFGESLLTVGWVLQKTGIIEFQFRQDIYTAIGLVFQIPAFFVAVHLLRQRRPFFSWRTAPRESSLGA